MLKLVFEDDRAVFLTSLTDGADLNENFIIRQVNTLNILESRKFYLFRLGEVRTLNEFLFFAVCNGISLTIKNLAGDILNVYSISTGDFNGDFNNDFNV